MTGTGSVQQEREGPGDRHGVQPYEDDLHLGIGAGAAGFTGDVRVGAEEAVEIRDDVAADSEYADEEGEEDDLDDIEGVVFHNDLVVVGTYYYMSRASASILRIYRGNRGFWVREIRYDTS